MQSWSLTRTLKDPSSINFGLLRLNTIVYYRQQFILIQAFLSFTVNQYKQLLKNKKLVKF